MQIIKRTADNIVVFAGHGLAIDNDRCIGPGWEFRGVGVAAMTIEAVDSIPEGFIGGGWTYAEGVWESNSIGESAILPGRLTKKIAELRSGYVAAVYSPIDYGGHTWGADTDSRTLLAQVLAVGSVPEGMYWRDSSGTPRAMTYADLQGLAYAILLRGLAADQNLMTKTAAANAATTAGEIDLIAW